MSTTRKTGLIILSWLGVFLGTFGISLMFGWGVALFIFGGFLTATAIIGLIEDDKKKKKAGTS